MTKLPSGNFIDLSQVSALIRGPIGTGPGSLSLVWKVLLKDNPQFIVLGDERDVEFLTNLFTEEEKQ